MKLPISNVVALYNILNPAKLTAMSTGDKFKVIRVLRGLRPVAREWDEFVGDTKKRLAPENVAELRKLQKDIGALSEAERARVQEAFGEWQRHVDECLSSAVLEEREVAVEPIGESAVSALLESNPGWDVSEIDIVDEILNAPEPVDGENGA